MLLPRIFITSLILCMSMTWCHFDITFSIEDSEERRKKIERLSRKIGYHKLLMETSILTAADDCYGVADVTNRLYTIDKNFGTPTTYIGPTGVLNIEAITISVDGTILYAMDDATWGTLNTTTGAFTAIGNVGTGNGPSGPHVFDDVDGLAVDARTGEYYGTERPFGDGSPEDYLFKLDPATGAIIPDGFGPGVDYIIIQTTTLPVTLYDVDDIAIDPITGVLYGVANDAGNDDRLIIIDRYDGTVTDVGRINDGGTPIDDLESLSFSNNGSLFTASATTNHFYFVDKTDASSTQLGTFPSGTDYEGIACLTDGANEISGTVFFDLNTDGVYNAGDTPSPGETVYLYEDNNNNNIVDTGDDLIQTEVTDATGFYEFFVGIIGNFVLSIDPGAYTMTTPDEIGVDFSSLGNIITDQDFGYYCGPPNARNDIETTVNNTPVDVDILANDSACEGIDSSSVSTTGVLQPSNGTLTSIDPVTGIINYLPNPDYVGVDSFEYIVCDLAIITQCDTAMVYIDIQCTGTAGQNDISGSVFYDVNVNQNFDAVESGEPGVTVYLYEDNTPNDSIPDGPPVQTTVTNALGGYGFTVYHTYFQTLNISSQINLASDDAREKQNGDVEDDKNEHKITKSGDDMINAFRFNNITLPSNALVNSAYITFTAKGDKNNTVAEVLIQGQDNTADAPTFLDCGGGCSDITVRDKTYNSVNWVIPPVVKDLTYDTPDLSAIIQEIIDDQSGISNAGVAFITEGQGPDYEERAFYSFDGDPTKAPILNINYTVPGDQPFNYVITIEETDLPVDAMMSTDNLETSSLYFDGVSDCENNFGYYLPGCKTIYTNGFLKYNAAR